MKVFTPKLSSSNSRKANYFSDYWSVLVVMFLAIVPCLGQAPCNFGVSVSPVGPITLCAGGSVTLTAAATIPSFNAGGIGFDQSVEAVVLQPDGKLLIGGFFTSYNGKAANHLVRLNADGSRDESFNPGGSGFDDGLFALVLQPDGKILVGGFFYAYNGSQIVGLVRLNPDGSRDTSFNAGGTGFTNEPSSLVVNVHTLALQPDGKILAAGDFTTYNGVAANKFVRLNANGSRDVSFNVGGSGVSQTWGENIYTIATQTDGKHKWSYHVWA